MEFTGPVAERVLRVAAQVAQAAPSIFNTQPWSWHVEGMTLQLRADRSRQLLVNDPVGRLLVVSCGAALHHARITLAVMGQGVRARRLPDPAEPDLLAVLELIGDHTATTAEQVMYAAIAQRRTDRRAYTAVPVASSDTSALIDAAEEAGGHLYLVRDAQVAELASVAAQASGIQLADPAYRRELASWVSPAGVPVETVAPGTPRRVPVRDFAPMGGAELDPGKHTDASARYTVVFTASDEPIDWLRAGEALSAVLLTATATGLATAPISDVTETALTRERMRRMLSGIGYPQLALRIGYGPAGNRNPPASPRRRFRDVID
jgi:nitroreductase